MRPVLGRRTLILGGVAVVVGLGMTLATALPTPDPAARARGEHLACSANLRAIALALRNYHDEHGAFPPAIVDGPDGRPWHSWRALILPYLEPEAEADRPAYDLGEPWDGPSNRALIDRLPEAYACPSHPEAAARGRTVYSAVTGPHTLFEPGQTPTLNEALHGAGETLMVVEAAGLDIPWTAPVDLDVRSMALAVDQTGRPCLSGRHPDGPNACLASGRVISLGLDPTPGELHALMTTTERGRPQDGSP